MIGASVTLRYYDLSSQPELPQTNTAIIDSGKYEERDERGAKFKCNHITYAWVLLV